MGITLENLILRTSCKIVVRYVLSLPNYHFSLRNSCNIFVKKHFVITTSSTERFRHLSNVINIMVYTICWRLPHLVLFRLFLNNISYSEGRTFFKVIIQATHLSLFQKVPEHPSHYEFLIHKVQSMNWETRKKWGFLRSRLKIQINKILIFNVLVLQI